MKRKYHEPLHRNASRTMNYHKKGTKGYELKEMIKGKLEEKELKKLEEGK